MIHERSCAWSVVREAQDGKSESALPFIGTWYSRSPDALAKELQTSFDGGLSDHEAQQRLQREGPNELPEAPPPSLLKLFLSQFTSVIVWVLIGAAVISGLLEDWLDAAAILAIVLLNGVLGFVQEFRAERSLAALRKMSVATARVFRDGILRSIPARELVPRRPDPPRSGRPHSRRCQADLHDELSKHRRPR